MPRNPTTGNLHSPASKAKSEHTKGERKQRKALPALKYNKPSVPMESICSASEELREKHPDVTDNQAQLVHLVLHTGKNVKQLCKSHAINEAWAYQTMRKEHVVAFRQQLAMQALGWDATAALSTMRALLGSKSQYLRFEAARDLMDRAGLKAEPQRAAPASASITINVGVPAQAQPTVTIEHDEEGGPKP